MSFIDGPLATGIGVCECKITHIKWSLTAILETTKKSTCLETSICIWKRQIFVLLHIECQLQSSWRTLTFNHNKRLVLSYLHAMMCTSNCTAEQTYCFLILSLSGIIEVILVHINHVLVCTMTTIRRSILCMHVTFRLTLIKYQVYNGWSWYNTQCVIQPLWITQSELSSVV